MVKLGEEYTKLMG